MFFAADYLIFISYRSEEEEDLYYHGDQLLPVFEWLSCTTERRYTVEEICSLLMDPNLSSSSKIAHAHPVLISDNVAFIIDTRKLKHKDDVKSDDMGVWINNRVDVTNFRYHKANRKVTRSKEGYALKRVYYKHGQSVDLRKIVSSIKGNLKYYHFMSIA